MRAGAWIPGLGGAAVVSPGPPSFARIVREIESGSGVKMPPKKSTLERNAAEAAAIAQFATQLAVQAKYNASLAAQLATPKVVVTKTVTKTVTRR